MNYIRTIEALTTILDDTDPLDYAKIMKRIYIDKSEINDFASWSKNKYTRNCIARTDSYEIILICWDIKVTSAIHCHYGNDCWVYQIDGNLEEKRYIKEQNNLKETHKIILHPKRLTYMHDRMGFHSIGNNSSNKAMSLHIYASPIDICTIYNSKNNSFEPQKLFYDTFKENKV